MQVFDKYTGAVIATVPDASANDVAIATKAAARAWDDYASWPAHRRSALLRKAAELVLTRTEDLTATLVKEAGKPRKFARAEVARCAEVLVACAEEAKRIHGETIPLDAYPSGEKRISFTLRVPVGVVAAITPFNFPLHLVAHKVGPALAAGCTIVLKPSEETPLSALALAAIFKEAGAPEGALQVVCGPGESTGEALVRDAIPRKVTFTGSRETGLLIKQHSGLKRVTLELGNNSGSIIEPDADLDLAVSRCVGASFNQAGQSCISLQRLYVHDAVFDRVRDAMVAGASKLVVGNPDSDATDCGPMISENSAHRAESWIREAEAQGARVLCGGKREGPILSPTVIDGATGSMRVVCEEVFAPVVSLIRYTQFEDALTQLAATPYGLQAGVFTRDIGKAFTAIRTLDMGGVMINDTSQYRVDHMPYGGNRDSGIGREGARYAIEEMTNLKLVCFNLS